MFPLFLTLRTMMKPGLAGIVILCALISAVFYVSIFAGVTWLTSHFIVIENRWLSALLNVSAGIITGIGGWFMLPSFTVFISGLFQEKAVEMIEKSSYPEAGVVRTQKFMPALWHSFLFTIMALSLNILILPLHFTGIGFIASIVLNSYLLGREFFEAVAFCHLERNEAKKLRKKSRITVYSGGFFITLMTLVPILNLFMPLIAVIWMVHVFHDLRMKRAA